MEHIGKADPLFAIDTADGEFLNHARKTIAQSIRHSSVREILFFLTAFVALDLIFGAGNRMIGVSLHPFWIIVLLVVVQYGAAEGVMAALLAAAFLLIGNLPEQTMTETMYDYMWRVASLPFMWVLTALVLGGFRARHLKERKELLERVEKSEQASQAIADSYKSLKHMKEQLEMRLAEERCSIRTVYEVAKSMETISPAEALESVARLVRVAFNPGKFSFYRLNGGIMHLDAAYGWKKTDAYTVEFHVDSPLMRTMMEEKRIVSIVDEGDESLLAGEGMLAGLIIDERTGKMYGMLKIEEIGFMELGIRMHETFRIVCEWIARVCSNIEKYESHAAVAPQQRGRTGDIHLPDLHAMLLAGFEHRRPVAGHQTGGIFRNDDAAYLSGMERIIRACGDKDFTGRLLSCQDADARFVSCAVQMGLILLVDAIAPQKKPYAPDALPATPSAAQDAYVHLAS